LDEWVLVKNILEHFSSASRLKINHGKYTFHHAGLEDAELVSYKDLYTFNFIELA
jgi:hypothetical protein